MARISDRSLLFRTKRVMSKDLAFVLKSKQLHRGTKQAVLDQVLWVWSEFEGKYHGCRLWSVAARASGSKREGLIHEHLIPRKIVRSKLFGLKSPTPEAVYRILQRWCVGVVVTKEEDRRLNDLKLGSSMPKSWNGKNKRARYQHAGIDIAP